MSKPLPLNVIEDVTVTHKCMAEQGVRLIELQPGTKGKYRGHVPIGNVKLTIDGKDYIVPERATDIAGQ